MIVFHQTKILKRRLIESVTDVETLVVKQLLSKEVDLVRIQILIEAVYISHIANTLGKSLNPSIILPTIHK